MTSLRSRVLEAVLFLGECSIPQVLVKVAGSISASNAAQALHRRHRARRIANKKRGYKTWGQNTVDPLLSAKRSLVSEALRRLAKDGQLRHVRKGVYAPPLLKIAEVEAAETA
jgi:hypothetical protein